MNNLSVSDQLKVFLENLISGSIEIFPRLLIGILVALLGLLLATLSKKLISRAILFLDHQLNARLRKRFLSVDLSGTARFAGIVTYWIIILFALVVVTQILGLAILTAWINALIGYLPNIITAVIIVFLGVIAGRLAGDLLSSSIIKRGIGTGNQLGKAVQFIVIFVASVIAVNQVGIDIQFLTNLITIIIAFLLFGAALAFGLGASTSVSNILGSYYLQKSYKEGNLIKLGEIEGIITKITATAVYVKTENGEVTIPAKVFNEEKSILLNESNDGN